MTLAIAHAEHDRAVLDVVREVRPPFRPEATVKEFADAFKSYGLSQTTSDRYAGSWPTEAFRKVGITVTPSERTRSEICLAVLPMVMSAQVELSICGRMPGYETLKSAWRRSSARPRSCGTSHHRQR